MRGDVWVYGGRDIADTVLGTEYDLRGPEYGQWGR